MPSKGRWTLNPKKWFGTIANSAHKRDKKPQINNPIVQLPSSTVTTVRITPTKSIVPRILTSRNKIKVIPTSSINDNNYINTSTYFTQFQLPPFNVRREKTSLLTSSSSSTTLFNRTNTFFPTHIKPSIRKNSQFKEELSIDTTRWTTETIVYDISKSVISPSLSLESRNSSQQNSSEKQSEINVPNISEKCLIDYPRISSNDFIKKSPSPVRSHSSSSIDDNDENDQSSSSGIFTDERADSNDHQRKASKDTLSTVEVLSIESIADSQTSLNYDQSSPLINPYRLPVSTFETINNKPSRLKRQTPITRFDRAQSLENILKNNQVATPIITKSRQSSAAIVKKIEKRIPTNRSPPVTLEKAGFVRISNATYRLTIDKDDHLYRRQRQNSIVQYSNYEDSLPPANDEESYATLPRTSSTEQLNTNSQNDIRAIIDDCLRPMVNSINKSTYRSIKTHHRSKRSHNNNEHTQINIDDITDKLLSSIACSAYAQYQRWY
jgi:hypothetical protein